MSKTKKYRSLIAMSATAALVASAVAPAAADYKDSTILYSDALSYLAAKGITKGTGNGYFGISDTLTRGDAAVMIAKALGLNTSNAQSSFFTDVNDRQLGAVNALYHAGVLSGKSKTTFAPDDEITRTELAKILSKALKLETEVGTTTKFKDVNANWAPYVNALVKHGLTKGKSATMFGATQSVTRGEFALFIYRGKDYLSNELADTVAPVLHYDGATNFSLIFGAHFTLPIVTATDDKDGDVKVEVIIRDSANKVVDRVNTLKPDTYTVTYSAKDKAGNMAKELVITVVVNQYVANPLPPEKDENFVLSLMHFNDTHAHLDNVAKRVTAVKEVRTQKPDALLLDAGDVFSGTLYFNEFLGQADLRFMNLMKVDAMTFGNHEFDLGGSPEGHKALVDFIKGANFPFVSSNVDFSKDASFNGLFNTKIVNASKEAKGNIYTGIIKEVKGEKVGIFGLTTADTADISNPGAITFSDYIAEAEKMVAEFEKMGVNKIVAITHIGYDDNPAVDNDLELAKQVEGIDIIVGGHSHTTLKEPVLIGNKKQPTIIVQAGQYGDYLGTLDVAFNNNGVVVEHNGELVKVGDKEADSEAAKILKEDYADKIAAIKNEEIGAIAVKELLNPRGEFDNVRKNETPLGNVITDGMLAKAKLYDTRVIMAMQNGGGIRAGINQGPITVGEVITVLPFGNTLATMRLSGSEIKQAFETSLRSYPGENGGFLHVSGARVKFDSSKPVGERVVSVEYDAGNDLFIEIADNEMYTIATNAFTAKGGDGFDVFKAAYADGRVTDLGLSDWENFRDHLISLGTVDPQIEGRIVDIAGEDPGEYPGGDYNGDDFSGTVDEPKIYNGNVTVDITEMLTLGNAVVRGNLTFNGTAAETLSFSNIKVTGNLILTNLEGSIFNFNGIEVDGEIIIE
ncbi:5'-nucleotidase C-terminal domain-containing protein [Sporosarcina sp. OR05]|uniref:5'-nucleotidase C-terminal domain-containing protein n=1 Tax=Sporosarcina sp. OR05 TaxID=2969819 RepID=UPI003529F890